MKSKDLKILRKKLLKAQKIDCNFILNHLSQDALNKLIENGSANSSELQQKFSLKFFRSVDLPEKIFNECLSLFEKNMGNMYRKSSWGLNMEEKKAEFKHKNAQYLLLSGDSVLAGFVHFRFEFDDDESPSQIVLYVYEIQVDEMYRRRGLGSELMDVIEALAQNADVTKIMLTVFKSNESAIKFYMHRQYSIDKCSPSEYNEVADYEILSRPLVSET